MKRLIPAVMLLVFGGPAYSQNIFWQQTAGPGGGEITALGFLDDLLFAGTKGGIFRSSDGGEHWNKVRLH